MNYCNSFTVNFSYPVFFTTKVFSPSNCTLLNVLEGDIAKIVFFVDDGLQAYWHDLEKSISNWCSHHNSRVQLASSVYYVQHGESIKNNLSILDYVGHVVEKTELCRQSYIAAIGGGAVLDAVGFAAAIIHRGIRLIRIPTTVIAQLDSGIGVKNSMNRFRQKNYYGTFAPPWAVINDFDFLQTLGQKDWISGIAEAFKVAIIKDKAFLDYLAKSANDILQRDQKTIEYIIKHCARLHMDHIRNSGDPFETGTEKPLDFGHWAAHRLEILTDFKLRHGEAVAIGIAIDLLCSVQLGLLSKEECEFALETMEQCGLSLWHEVLDNVKIGTLALFKGMGEFKRHQGECFTITMPNGLGEKTEIYNISLNLISNAIDGLRKRKDLLCVGMALI